jgi:hypothetical protein
MTIDQQIKHLKKYPTGLTYPVINEIIESLSVLKTTYSPKRPDVVIRAMSGDEARQFDEFKQYKQFTSKK